MKHRVVVEIKGGKNLAPNVAGSRMRLNLDKRRDVEIFLMRSLKIFAVGATIFFLLFGFVRAPSEGAYAAQRNVESDARRKELQAQLSELERQAEEQAAIAGRYRAQGATLSQEIKRLNAQIAKLNFQIRAVRINLLQLDGEITKTKSQITRTEGEIEKNKGNLSHTLRALYESDRKSVVEILLANANLSDFFGNIENLMIMQENLRASLQATVKLKTDLALQKEQLALERSDVEELERHQVASRVRVANIQNEKSVLLKETKGKESEYRVLLEKTRKSAAEIRQQIFRLFGGGKLSFEEAYNIAHIAERATGVRSALILAVLEQESRLGGNVGQCSPERAINSLRDRRGDLRKLYDIVGELRARGEFVPEPLMVSCPILSDGPNGGAMGPAQFIPSTWLLYKDDITRITGNNPPNPWRNADAFVGTALYLKNSLNSSSCINYADRNRNTLPHQFLLERCAAAKYYAGGNWFRFRFAYGNPVMEKTDRFQRDINVMTGGLGLAQ